MEEAKTEAKPPGVVTSTTKYKSSEVPTKPIMDMKMGTSGLRKKTKIWKQPNFRENFFQAFYDELAPSLQNPSMLVISGDGRYLSRPTIALALRIAAANGVDEVHIGRGGLFSTPAISSYIRRFNKEQGNCLGGFVLTASHNPGGPDEDFGIKFNDALGAPA